MLHLYVGLRKVKQETTALQIVSLQRTPSMKNKHCTPLGFEITATPQGGTLFTASLHWKNNQHCNIAMPHVKRGHVLGIWSVDKCVHIGAVRKLVHMK